MIIKGLANTAEIGVLHMLIEQRLDMAGGQVRIVHDPVGKSMFVCYTLQPTRLTRRVLWAKPDIQVNEFDDVLVAAIPQKVRATVAGTEDRIVSKGAWFYALVEPGIVMLIQILQMMVCINDRQVAHCYFPSEAGPRFRRSFLITTADRVGCGDCS